MAGRFCQAEGDLHSLLGCMGAAFEDCRGLTVSTEEAAAVLRGVHRISNMAETTRKHVELASGMLSLIPDSALAVDADDGAGKAGLAASCSEAGLAAPDTDAGMTARDPGSASTRRKRLATTLLGWDVVSPGDGAARRTQYPHGRRGTGHGGFTFLGTVPRKHDVRARDVSHGGGCGSAAVAAATPRAHLLDGG